MKYKALFMILLAAMLVTNAFAFLHPEVPEEPTPPCNTFGVKIEDEWCYGWDYAVEFHEPEDNFCDTFSVQVLAVNVTDLYGFEYKLHWSHTYFALVDWTIEQVWADQLVVVNKTEDAWHKLVVVAKAPSPGVNDPDGGILLCTYTFHIINDVCWPQGCVQGKFFIDEYKMSDSCTGDLEPCTPIDAYWKFFAAEPEVYIKPDEDINCVVGESVTYTVEVHNITKMKSIHFTIKWKGNKLVEPCRTVWREILRLKEVIINEDVFPEDNCTTYDYVIFNNPANTTSWVKVDLELEDGYPLINSTEPDYKVDVVDLVFEKMDPWYCGRQPGYDIDLETHEMKPDNATTPLWFDSGYIDVRCPCYAEIWFGRTVPEDVPYASFNEAKFTFMPVPGDLTGDGLVNIKDLTAIAAKYCNTYADWMCGNGGTNAETAAMGYDTFDERWIGTKYYDFNGDFHIDIFDIIVVSKNWERSCPF